MIIILFLQLAFMRQAQADPLADNRPTVCLYLIEELFSSEQPHIFRVCMGLVEGGVRIWRIA